MSTTFLRTKVFNGQLVNILFKHIVRIIVLAHSHFYFQGDVSHM